MGEHPCPMFRLNTGHRSNQIGPFNSLYNETYKNLDWDLWKMAKPQNFNTDQDTNGGADDPAQEQQSTKYSCI